ncbi:NAD-dependent epimerase/dehydratase family protein [Candidatus Gottesmanbacteria bacterium]|nr:NAD-dependent epimerase/dehydratase family protein [Candidatus Gottesmanbacteria bacterium]
MKILVTGGAGFIASHIVDAYINLGHDVVIVDNLSSGRREFINKKAKFYQADIRDRDKIKDIFTKERPEVLNHHAAQISVRESVLDPINDAEINILGLLNLLEAGRKNGVKKIIFASSGGVVYGEAKQIPTHEDYNPLQPLSPYGVSKLASEYYLNFYYTTYGIQYFALRYSNVYGPRQNPHGEAGVVAIFSLKLLNGEIPIINGDGKQTRDYVYVGDVVEANKIALTSSEGGVFNIGTGIETNVLEIYQNIKEITGSSVSAKHGPAKSGEQKRSCLDSRLAAEKLDWKAKINLDEGLKKTIEYFKSHYY